MQRTAQRAAAEAERQPARASLIECDVAISARANHTSTQVDDEGRQVACDSKGQVVSPYIKT